MTDKSSAKAKPTAAAKATQQAKENERQKTNERPLVEDIRLLGRILGDVIREQEGKEAYELVEQVRKLSVAFRRDSDANADKALKPPSVSFALSRISATWLTSRKTATTFAAAPSMSVRATHKKAACTWR
jgi:phosphoenolpyruvate carboxylase